ncbi:outer membrane beta-barrel protein [Bradyrhizobium sp. NP1]|uniref:outer membrane protein n=1 Tax=Bradyrhizobium sp. NP1 TaxID=3049772 RepID=UPI0025A5149E|nr:outer membrane beta-barrel protein [Bradyrhizobium sp. NP1]WJR76312.1 outer membrane beta-barrel protein [Bradyrhizobium sp. NP1]
MSRSAVALIFLMAGTLPAAAQGWTGGYVGGSAGYGSGSSSQTDPGIPKPLTPVVIEEELPADGHYSVRGGLVGGTLGYNWQKGLWVYGVEGDFSWADIKGQSSTCGPMTATPHPCGTNLDSLATFRGRIGYALGGGGSWLVYGTGGLAVGNIRGWDSLSPASGSDWRAGWALGAGVETAIAPNWSVKLEYLHVDLGDGQLFNVVPGVAESVSFKADTVRVGINYRFGDPLIRPVAPPPYYTKAPYTKAPVLAPTDPWSGWYAGLNLGYIDGSGSTGTSAGATSASTFPGNTAAMVASATQQLSTGQSGILGGAQIGYNRLISPTWLAGLEADIQGTSLHGSAFGRSRVTTVGGFFNDTAVTSITTARSLDYIGTIRGRLGGLVTPNLLLYATGGLAYGNVKSNTNISQGFATFFPPSPAANLSAGSFSATRAGYTVGAGGEWMWDPKWSAKLEYLYYDLGSANYGTGISAFDAGAQLSNGFGIDSIAMSSRVRFNGNIVRAGVNYHLN